MKAVVIFFLLIFSTFKISAQDYFSVSGTIAEKQTKRTLPFASIYVSGSKNYGTVSNENGNFILKIAKDFSFTDTLEIAYSGFKTFTFSLQNLKADKNFDTIFLVRNDILLEEVTILPVKAKEIIQKAIEKISENYDLKPLILNAFYRQIQVVKPLDFVSENIKQESYEKEAVMDIYHSQYKANNKKADNDNIKLIAWRKKNEIQDTVFKTALENLHGSGPNYTINNDPLKDIKNSFLGEKKRRNYTFTLNEISIYNDNEVYVITFDQADKAEEQLYKGTLYIDRKSFAFVEINYELSPKGNKYNLLKKNAFMGFKILQDSGKIIYRKYGNKWNIYFAQNNSDYNIIFYNSFIFKNWFKKNAPGKEKATLKFSSQDQLVVTDVEKNNVAKFNKDDLFKKSTELKLEMNKENKDIWGKYNIIKMP